MRGSSCHSNCRVPSKELQLAVASAVLRPIMPRYVAGQEESAPLRLKHNTSRCFKFNFDWPTFHPTVFSFEFSLQRNRNVQITPGGGGALPYVGGSQVPVNRPPFFYANPTPNDPHFWESTPKKPPFFWCPHRMTPFFFDEILHRMPPIFIRLR